MKKDFISVLLPVYNAEKFLAETLDSILRQTYEHFEILAVNDGSTDSSLAILKEYAKRDRRIIIVDKKNEGIVKTLNLAAEMASGEFLARMDADDISLPRRFELQLEAFRNHKKAVLIAGGFDVMDDDGEFLYHEAVPTKDTDLRLAMYSRNPIAHGSVMFRNAIFKDLGGYSSECGPTEDYELWSRMIQKGEFIALGSTVFRWRINPGGITQTKAASMESYMKRNLDTYWQQTPPSLFPTSYLREHGAYYFETFQQHGVGMKHTMLRDAVSLGVALMRQKKYSTGLRQIISVALTGRTGVRIVSHRVESTFKFHVKRLLSKKD